MNSTAKHPPGPWNYAASPSHRLIAAAPELLEALKACEHELAAYYHWQMQTNPSFPGSQGDVATLRRLDQARAAIARAEEGEV